ncbi:putative lipoprotein [Plesiocystis pacifica SIR-1]|uniref:Putative lipoprotein n=1 Tax=Plesiocystis pacifica SIR-1 TaxID=391625 RepID=A6GFG0_9BACT|nr:vWA domain-containing protein [Plesiocystis pacifica]EDM75387.1 putative lipoprotein [Plesiocystis pacifica SIR-1]
MSRFTLGNRFALLAAAAMVTTSLTGCLNHPLKPVELEKAQTKDSQLQLTVNKDVDILFVIDNSGSMGEEQANLAANFGAFIGVLEDEEVEANYRIGVTTTDNGNPWCPPGQTTPEGGNLVLSPCTGRLNDFLFGTDVDVQALACTDICTLSDAELEIQDSITAVDPDPKPHPWLENIEGQKNIPEGTSTTEAFQCFGPQGVNGCGFESQLESMYLALVRAVSNGEDNYGFLRDAAILAIVQVTDEADCSYNKDWSSIFDEAGSKVFWSDPESPFPTSAVCWNAGVECTGDPSSFDECHSANYDENGNVGASDDNAVLHPVTRYTGLVQDLETNKQALNPDQEVIVALIGGVDNDGEAFYGEVGLTDPGFQESFGIGPGCTAPNPFEDPMIEGDELVEAVPPVRLKEFTDHFSPGNLFSVCNPDYAPALEAVANAIRDQIQPACYTQCAKDVDESTDILDAECTVEENAPGAATVSLEECLRDDNGYVIDPGTNDYTMPSDDVNVCFATLVDIGGQTPDPNDDMSMECLDLNYNLEFSIARRPGFPAAGGTSISATCSLSEFATLDCPDIGVGG